MREHFLTPDLSISGKFKQLWFWWQKSSPPPPPPRMREKILTPDLSISGKFKQLWFWWQKSPPRPQDEGNFFDTRSIHFRQIQATLVFVAEKPPPPPQRKCLCTRITTRYERPLAGYDNRFILCLCSDVVCDHVTGLVWSMFCHYVHHNPRSLEALL